MAITNLSTREFDKNIEWAKKAADKGPVFIHEHGRPAYVLLSLAGYEQLVDANKPPAIKSATRIGSKLSIVDLLAIPVGTEGVDLEFPKLNVIPRPVDFD